MFVGTCMNLRGKGFTLPALKPIQEPKAWSSPKRKTVESGAERRALGGGANRLTERRHEAPKVLRHLGVHGCESPIRIRREPMRIRWAFAASSGVCACVRTRACACVPSCPFQRTRAAATTVSSLRSHLPQTCAKIPPRATKKKDGKPTTTRNDHSRNKTAATSYQPRIRCLGRGLRTCIRALMVG